MCTMEIKLHCANPTQLFLCSVMRPIGLPEECCCYPSRGGLPHLYLPEPRPASLSTRWSWSIGDGCHMGREPPHQALVLWVRHTWGHVLLGTCRRCFLATVWHLDLTLVMSPVGLVGCVCVMTQAQQAAAWWVLLHPPEPSGCVGACHPRRVPGATRALAQGKEGLQRAVKKQRLRDRFGCCVSLCLGVIPMAASGGTEGEWQVTAP